MDTIETGFASLKRLASGENDTLHAVDGSAIYHGWDDLVATLREIIAYERGRPPLFRSMSPRPMRGSIRRITPIIS